ncbi:hypothetical protein KSS87_000198 [Heliosperma pusillum]|nr:hypothetical protein KSS87_000198 [Heliosperma pusillum]
MVFFARKTSVEIPLLIMLVTTIISGSTAELTFLKHEPTPRKWPEKFHSLQVMNYTDTNMLVVNNLWYDWQNGLNVQLMQYQQGKLVHAVSWNNGTSFYFTLKGDRIIIECITHEFGVGILRPDFLEGANYLGQVHIDGFLCNLWEKEEFIWYYEDVVTKRPIHWQFYNGIDVHVMTFEEVDEMLEESHWQAPDYCFDKAVEISTDSGFTALGLSRNPLITLRR